MELHRNKIIVTGAMLIIRFALGGKFSKLENQIIAVIKNKEALNKAC